MRHWPGQLSQFSSPYVVNSDGQDLYAYSSKLIQRCTSQTDTILEGFSSAVHTQMYWKVYQDKFLTDAGADVREVIAGKLVELYAGIIEYQARVICHLSEKKLRRAWKVFKSETDWKANSAKVEHLNQECRDFLSAGQEADIRKSWVTQLKSMREQLVLLDAVRGLLKDNGIRAERRYEDERESKLFQNLASGYEGAKDFIPERVDGTCEWFFNDQRFRQWRDTEKSALFLVSAGPGCGKSVLSRSLIDDGRLTTGITTSIVCYFFFKDGEQGRMESTDAISAILHQLFRRDTSGQLINQAMSAHHAFGDKLPGEFAELWNILTTCAQSPGSEEIVCVLDALDECAKPSRDKLIGSLQSFYRRQELQSTSRLKFFITSRPYDDIRFPHLQSATAYNHLKFDGDHGDKDKSDALSHDISLVVDHTTKELANTLDEADRRQLAAYMKRQKGHTYLWLHLIFQIIKQKPSLYSDYDTINDELLSDLPSSVEEAYEKILERNQDAALTEILLSIILVAVSPLTLDEMNIALTLASHKKGLSSHAALRLKANFKDIAQNLTGLFISVHESKLYFIHQTAREFLMDKHRKGKWQGILREPSSHQNLSRICVRYLMLPEFTGSFAEVFGTVKVRNGIIGRNYRYHLEESMKEFPFFSYAACNWCYHYRTQGPVLEKLDRQHARELCLATGPQAKKWILPALLRRKRYLRESYWKNFTDLTVASYFGLTSVIEDILTIELSNEIHRQDMPSEEDFREGDAFSKPRAFRLAMEESYTDVIHVWLDKVASFILTEEMVMSAAIWVDENVMMTLLGSEKFKCGITQGIARAAVANWDHGHALVKLLLLRHRDTEGFEVNEDLLMAAIANGQSGMEITDLFLKNCADKLEITRNILIAVVKNRMQGDRILKMLHDTYKGGVKMPEDILEAAGDMMLATTCRMILDNYGDRVRITQEAIESAARNLKYGLKMMKMLLHGRGCEFNMTEDIMMAAATKREHGAKWVEFYLQECQEQIWVSEKLIVAMMQNWESGPAMLRALLREGIQIAITKNVVTAAVGEDAARIMTVSSQKRSEAIEITEELLTAVIQSCNARLDWEPVAVLIEGWGNGGNNVEIVERVLIAALQTRSRNVELEHLWDMLLEKGQENGHDIEITQQLLQAIAQTNSHGRLLSVLFKHCGSKLSFRKRIEIVKDVGQYAGQTQAANRS